MPSFQLEEIVCNTLKRHGIYVDRKTAVVLYDVHAIFIKTILSCIYNHLVSDTITVEMFIGLMIAFLRHAHVAAK